MVTTFKRRTPAMRNTSILLGVAWSAGFFCGGLAALALVDVFRESTFRFVSAYQSPITFWLPTFLPFLFSALAVYLRIPKLLVLICAIKAALFGFCGCSICLSYHQSSWLVLVLFLFTDLCTVPVLYLYWLRSLCAKNSASWSTYLCFGSFFLAICAIDWYFILPFTEYLFSN